MKYNIAKIKKKTVKIYKNHRPPPKRAKPATTGLYQPNRHCRLTVMPIQSSVTFTYTDTLVNI